MWGYNTLPVTRNYRTGRPLNDRRRVVNVSAVIREILDHRPDASNNAVHDQLLRMGLSASDGLITKQRQRQRQAA
jgi:hypothetical protein